MKPISIHDVQERILKSFRARHGSVYGCSRRWLPAAWKIGATALPVWLGLIISVFGASTLRTGLPLPQMPLFFEAVPGHADEPSQFLARGCNYQFLIGPAEAQIVLTKAEPSHRASPLDRSPVPEPRRAEVHQVRMSFLGANPHARPSGYGELRGKINCFLGDHPEQWRSGVSLYAKVQVADLYPGVDLVYYGDQRQLEYDFNLAPGADPASIGIRFEAAEKVSINPQGDLVLSLGAGELHQPRPVMYQFIDGVRRFVQGGYRVIDARTVGVTVGKYDSAKPLVIDPTLSYATFFGGNANDAVWSVKVDGSGAIYLAGQTLSSQFPFAAPVGGFQTTNAGGRFNGDAFVAKLDSTGTNLIYFTFLGGSGNESALDLAIDGAGHAYVTGYTDSTNFPVLNALFPQISSKLTPANVFASDAFVSELNSTGSGFVFSTYLGGNNIDSGIGIAVDTNASAYVTGYTFSTNFPTVNPLPGQDHLQGSNDVFVAKFAPGGTALLYSTYLGGTNYDVGQGIAVDAAGFAYVTGYTASTNFPSVNGLINTNGRPSEINRSTNSVRAFNHILVPYDAFVTKLSTNGSSLIYSTFLGGQNNDSGFRIKVDGAGDAYVTGSSYSWNFPTNNNISGFLQYVTNNIYLNSDVFLARIGIDTNGLAITKYCFLWGGPAEDVGWDLALDPVTTNVFVLGTTSSTNFPVFNSHAPFLQATNISRSNDVFVTAFVSQTNGAATLYSVYLGGVRDDFGYGIDVDAAGSAFIVGQTLSGDFPATRTALQSSLVGSSDGFLAKILFSDTLLAVPIQTVPAGLAVVVDGTNYTTPVTLTWIAGTPHTITTPNLQAGGTGVRYLWDSWSDGGLLSHQVYALDATPITATFQTQFLLTTATTNGGAAFPPSGWYIAGANVSISAIPANGTTFAGWTGSVGGFSGTNNPATVTMDGPITETVAFAGAVNNILTVAATGIGTFLPDYNGKALQVGRTFSMTAKPGAGYVFSSWTGSTSSPNAVLSFVMQNGMVLQADFVPNPFVPAKGTYTGLFSDPSSPTFTNSGFFTATLTDKGSFSAKLIQSGKNYSLTGQLSASGSSSNAIPRGKLSPLIVLLQLDSSGSRITGHIGDVAFDSPLVAYRPVYSKANPATQGGKKYTLIIPGSPDSLIEPGGDGIGAISVDTSGNLQFAGVLGDGTPVSQRSFVSGSGQWPFFNLLYSGRGSIAGWLTFTNEPGDDLSGTLAWFKLQRAGTKVYPGGFALESAAIGSVYSFTNGSPVLNFSQGRIVFEHGNLAASITNQISLSNKNKVTSTNKLNLTITTSSGLFQGSVLDPASRRTLPFKGVVFQKQNVGSGQFSVTNQTGHVFLGP